MTKQTSNNQSLDRMRDRTDSLLEQAFQIGYNRNIRNDGISGWEKIKSDMTNDLEKTFEAELQNLRQELAREVEAEKLSGTHRAEYAEGYTTALDRALAIIEGGTEQYKCKSYFDNNNKLQDCTCGKCK